MSPSKIKNIDYLFALVSYFSISVLILGGIILTPGTVGFFHDWFLGPFEEMNQTWARNGLYSWDTQYGYKSYYTDWIFRVILSFFPSSVLDGEVLSKGLLIMVMTLSGFGSYCLGKRLKLGPYIAFAVGILYVFSPIVFTRIVAGHIYYLIGYSLSPLVIATFLKGKEENRNSYFIAAALLLSFAVIQIQFLVMILLILLVFSLVDFKKIKKSVIGLSIVISVTLLISFSPTLLAQLFTTSEKTSINITQLLSYAALNSASDLAKSFRILGYEVQPYSYLRLDNTGIIPFWVFYLDFLIPIIGFSALFFRKDKYTISLAIISVIGLYLLKGTHAPLSGVFVYLFTHGLFIFRELWHVAFLYSISITFLVAFFLERLAQLRFKALKIPIAAALISLIVVSNGYPLLLGDFGEYLQTYDFPEQYHTLYTKLQSEPESNVLILPYVNPIKYDNLRLNGLDLLIMDSSSMIFPSILPNSGSATGASTWLLSSMQQNMTQNLGNLLSGFGIKYIVLRDNFDSNYLELAPRSTLYGLREKWHESFEQLLDSQENLKLISNTSEYKVYENQDNPAKIFAPQTSLGGLTDFDSLNMISNLTSLSRVAFYPQLSSNYSLNFVDTSEERNMSDADVVDLGKYATTFNPKQGWTTNRIAFGYDHQLASRVNEGIFTISKGSEASFKLPAKYDNKHIEIWIKALAWNQGGLVNIQINGKDRPLSLFSPDNEFRLVKIFEGESSYPYEILIKNNHGNSYLERLYIREGTNQSHYIKDITIANNGTNQKQSNLIPNPSFPVTALNVSGLPSHWNDQPNTCGRIFNCRISVTEGWDDNTSFQLATKRPHNRNNSSSIYGQQIDVKPNEQYQVITHMKLNRWANQSHVALEGYNETSNNWEELMNCPSGRNGPLEWITRICQITIPDNITKIAPVLNAGWSYQRDKVARTWFDALAISKISDGNQTLDAAQFNQLTLPLISDNKSAATKILEYNKVNPTLWNLRINTVRPATIAFAEPFDQRWEATVYRDGIKVDTVKSTPLYGAINSFQINHTGNLDIALNFAAQYWYNIGFVISGITLVSCIIYIIYDWRINRIKPLP